MSQKIAVLVVEDSDVDARLLVRKLSKEGGYEVSSDRVDSLKTFQAALDKQGWDLIVSDHSMPQFSALKVLQELNERKLDIPVIIVSGTIRPDAAVAAMKAGASDYIMKDDLTRLLPAIERELHEAGNRREKRSADKAVEEKNLQIRLEQEKFLQITDAVEDAVWLATHDMSEIIYMSPAYERIWGRPRENLYRSPEGAAEVVHPEDRELWSSLRPRLASGGEMEYRIYRPDGDMRWIKVRGFPIKDPSGKITRVAGVARDITREKELQAQFQQAQKMDAIGQLSGGIAHDFNNILTAILGYAALLISDPVPSESWRGDIEEIRKAGERASALTRQLLAFSRKQVLQPRVMDLNAEFSDVEKMLRRLVGSKIEWAVSLAPGLRAIKADPGQIQQVLMNLIVNARDAMPDGGKLTVKTENVDVAAPRSENGFSIPAGAYVCVAIGDTGVGMDENVRSRIFEPFFTTKGKDKGTGLGLSVVYGIVNQGGGFIAVDSAPKKGTTFAIYFPAVEGTVADTSAKPEVPEIQESAEAVLVVDDDADFRHIVRRILSYQGYAVTEAGSGADALKAIQAHQGKLHLLLTDIGLPDFDGLELAKRCASVHPEARAIFISGTSSLSKDGGNLVLDGEVHFLPKPVHLESLLKMVRAVLDAAPVK